MMENRPANIFVQILEAIRIVNDNVVALADNLRDTRDAVARLEAFATPTEPMSPGTDEASKQ